MKGKIRKLYLDDTGRILLWTGRTFLLVLCFVILVPMRGLKNESMNKIVGF